MVKTIVGSFDGYPAAHRAAGALIDAGFMQHDISVIASNIAGDYTPDGRVRVTEYPSNAGAGAVAGGLVGGAAGLTAGLMGLAIPGLGPIIAAGALVSTLTGAGAGAVAGGLIGALTKAGVPEEHATYYAESLRRGGALVTIDADLSRAEEATAILRNHGGHDIEERAMRWRDAGWSGWDPAAAPYTADEAERERQLFGTHADPISGLPMTRDPERDNRRDSTIRR